MKDFPTWCEIDFTMSDGYDFDSIASQHEVVLCSNNYTIIFYNTPVKLIAQEYKFVLAILKKNGKRINANKLMSEIGSRCQEEMKQPLSYRIKSKIKNKLKKALENECPDNMIPFDPEENDWYVFNKDWQFTIKYPQGRNGSMGPALHYQQFYSIDDIFTPFIYVKDGFYSTKYQKGLKKLKRR